MIFSVALVSFWVYFDVMGKKKYKLRKVADRPCIQIQWEGTSKWLSTGCKTMADAREWADSQTGDGTKKIKFDSYAKCFFTDTSKTSKQIRDLMDNRAARQGTYMCNQVLTDCCIIPFFKGIDIKTITPKLIDEWKMWLRFEAKTFFGKNYSVGTINRALSMLSMILDSAVYDEIISANPAKSVKRLGGSSKPKPIWKEEDIVKLFPSDENEFRKIWSKKESDNGYVYGMICLTLFYTGLRPSECFALKRSNIYADMNAIHTSEVIDWYTMQPYNAIKTSNKGKKYKVCIVPEEFMKRLVRYIDSLPKEQEYLFLKKNGEYINARNIFYPIKVACNRVGIESHGAYTFRHNFITKSLSEYDRKTVMEMAGHTTYEACYDHRTPRQIIEELKAMMDKSKR